MAGAIISGLCSNNNRAKIIAVVFAVLELILTLLVLFLFDRHNSGFQLLENYSWIPNLNIEFLLGIDGISVLFLPLSAMMTLMAIIASWNSVQHFSRFYFALLLILEGISIGVFCALDLMLFFMFWELTLLPVFFLTGLWGIGPERRSTAIKYILLMLFGDMAVLFAIIIICTDHVSVLHGSIPLNLTFSLPDLLETPLSENQQTLVFLLLLLGFAVKAPLVPFHTWLPRVAMEASCQTTALLVGLKLGIFGLIRFCLPLAPEAAIEYNWVLGILGAISLIYCGLIALKQTSLRRLLAYSSVSHAGLVIIGIASFNIQGIQGAIFELINFTLIASSLMLIAGFIQHRLGSTEVLHLGGLAKVMPRLTGLYFLFALASMGMPGTSGFPAMLLLVISALSTHPSLAVTALAATVLCAAYMSGFFRRAFLGKIIQTPVYQLQDLRPRELLVLSIPAFIIILLGFFPNIVLKTTHDSASLWLSKQLEQSEEQSH
jgi:NADH-quinone oxidoreductase subunit M